MEFKAKLRYLRMSPRKVRLVIDTIRGLDVIKARNKLHFINRTAVKPVLKLLESAIANAKNNYEHLGIKVAEENLYIKTISADLGPSLKRWRPRAFGRASPILKRSTHINLVLAEKKPSKVKKLKKAKAEDLKVASVSEIKEDEKNKIKEPTVLKEEAKPKTRFSKLTRFIRRTGAK